MSAQDKGHPAEGRRASSPGRAMGRRRFIAGALTLTGGGALAGAGAATVRPEPEFAEGDDSTRLTYRETEHIRQFYARCRF